jgi:hypothetical protein
MKRSGMRESRIALRSIRATLADERIAVVATIAEDERELMGSSVYKLSFQMRHPDLDLEEVCKRLGLTPQHIWKAGDRRRTPKGTVLDGYRDASYCSIRFDDDTEGSLPDKINSAIARLNRRRSVLEEVSSSGGRLSFFIGWFSTGDSGDTIDWKSLESLAELKINLELNVYCGERA